MGCGRVFTSSDISGEKVAAALVCAATNRAAVCFSPVCKGTERRTQNGGMNTLLGSCHPPGGRC